MGIEPTWDPYEPHTDFEDQGRHQAPITSALKGSGFRMQHLMTHFSNWQH